MNNSTPVNTFLREFSEIGGCFSEKEIDRVIEILFEAWKKGNRIFIIGNGGSASTATHFACDLAKGTAVEGKKRFRVISLTDNVSLLTALTNDNGFASVFVEQLKNLLEKDDVVIAIGHKTSLQQYNTRSKPPQRLLGWPGLTEGPSKRSRMHA